MTETTQEKRNYKKTLNLPKTSFPMKANLAQNEPASEKRWAKGRLYETIVAQREAAGATPFVFHDGPPYANGAIHVGHLLNKVLKDLVVRSRFLAGNQCKFIPGWDCHGLPIEHKVMTELMESGKAAKLDTLSEDDRRMAIRRECKKSASKYIKLQAKQMKRLLTLADYDNPYLTMAPAYEKAVLEVFATMVEQGLVYRALKSVHWSIANETALAEAELEYQDREDLSVYVKFDGADKDAVGAAFGIQLDETPSFMIWTTTPWTLPANLAIAVHERISYRLMRVDGAVTIIASELAEKVTQAAGAKSVETLAETEGKKLVGLQYKHPLCDRVSPVVSAEYVTLEDGTGMVHTAPGHGVDDYLTGMKEGLDIYCPVLADGRYDETVPEWLRGMLIWDANPQIAARLQESGHLFYSHKFMHSYPHDWRSKTPVIFRATDQWFIAVDKPVKDGGESLRDMALRAIGIDIEHPVTKRQHQSQEEEAEAKRDPSLGEGVGNRSLTPSKNLFKNIQQADSVEFVPAWGKNRMRGMLETRPDWCISRQRSWGLPIPSFQTAEGETFLTAASVRAVAECFATKGSDAWFTEPPEVLLETYDPAADPDLPSSLQDFKPASLTKMYDIFDVWFESGSSWNAVMRERGEARTDDGPWTDLYLEGSDQHRGWFQLSMLPSLGATGKMPFKTLLTHGFMVAKDGKKMSKTGGNALEVEELLKSYGADICRWWVSSLAYENDIKVDEAFFKVASESYRKVRNTLKFLLSNLDDFEPCTPGSDNPAGMCVDLKSLDPTSIDSYILNLAAELQTNCMNAFERYEFRKANQMLYDFCNDTLSAFYCAAVKDRLYCDKPESERRRITQTVMWDVLEILTRLLSPIMPHTADEAYRSLWKGDENRCVHGKTAVAFDDLAPAQADWPKVMDARDAGLKALEAAKEKGIDNPLDAEVVLVDPDGTLAKFKADLPDMLGVSRVKFVSEGEVTINDLRDEPRCERSWKRDGTVKQRSDGGMLSDRDAEAVGVE